MHKISAGLFPILVVLLLTPSLESQVDEGTLAQWVKTYKANSASDRISIFSNAGQYLSTLKVVQDDVVRPAMHAAEEKRMDKQTESSASSGGGTSAVSKGSVPWLFAFALEHGALTQSVDGNLVTMRGNVANIIKAISARDYIASYELGQDNPFVRAVSAASFAVSFASSPGNASPTFNSNSISNASAHVDLYNRRDPRDPKWRALWAQLVRTALTDVATARGRFISVIQANHGTEFDAWQQAARTRLTNLSDTATDKEITDALRQTATEFAAAFGNLDDVRESAEQARTALAEYVSKKTTVRSSIEHSPILSFEYTYTNQSTVTLPSSTTQNFSVGQVPPNLSGLNLIFAGYLVADSQFTLNASTNLFHSTLPGTSMGHVRDYRLSGQVDMPLPEIPNLGRSSISLSGVFLSLLEEPLGQQVLVNSVPVSTRGNIRLFQAKWTIPVSGAGVRIPISFTSSNRTELINESEKRGSIGITFDLDNLFSKP